MSLITQSIEKCQFREYIYTQLLFFILLGMWLCGLLVSGELFLWNRDKDLLKTVAAAPEVVHIITSAQGMHSMYLLLTYYLFAYFKYFTQEII